MPIEPEARASATRGEVIMTDRPCKRCGYNLKGLETGGLCPECGAPIRIRRKSVRFADNLVDSPMWYLKLLAAALGAMALVIGLSVALWVALVAGAAGPGLGGLAATGLAAVWFGAVWTVTFERPHGEKTLRDEILDNPRLREAARWGQGFGVLSAFSWWMAGLAGWTALDVVSGALSLGVLAGIVPLGIYLSSLADWSGDTNVGSRLRASAWCITVCGTLVLAALLLILLPVPLQGLFGVAAIVLSIIVAVGFVLFCVSVVQLALTSVWAIQNSYEAREREIRIEERKRRDAEAHGTRAQMADAASEDDGARAEARRTKPCRECGYDLTGLPGAYEGGGVCPECGTRFEKLEVYKPEYTEDATIPDAIPLAGDEEEPAADRPGEQAEREHAEEPRDERRKRELDPYELAPDDET